MSSARHPRRDPNIDLFEKHEAKIRQLYQNKRKTLPEVKHIMESQHGFPDIPLSTYETRLREELRLRKNLKRVEWHAVYQHLKRREGRETGIYINGTRKPWNSAWKEMRRSGARSGDQDQFMPLPAYVSVRTPSPVGSSLPLPSSEPSPDNVLLGTYSERIIPEPESSLVPISLDMAGRSDGTFLSFVQGEGELLSAAQLRKGSAIELDEDYSYDGSSMIFASRVVKFTAFLVPALEKWRYSLQEIPWNIFKRGIFAIPSSEMWLPGASNAASNHIAQGLGQDLPTAWEISYPSIFFSFSDPKPSPTTLAFNFDILHYMTKVVYLVSNKLIKWSVVDEQIPDILKILLIHLPHAGLFELLQNDLPTVRATWETLTLCAGRHDLRDAYHLLMTVGLRHHSWVLSNGPTYLSFAASMDDHALVRDLLKLGIRPDDSFCTDYYHSPYPAIIEAAATGSVECLRILVKHCDLNRIIMYSGQAVRTGASSFGIFLHAITTSAVVRFGYPWKFEKTSQSLVLSLLLEFGGNVDSIYVHDYLDGFDDRLHTFHEDEEIPVDLRPTLFERIYFRDPNLFQTLVKYSARATSHITRPGICTSAKQGSCAILQYIESRTAHDGMNTMEFMELIFAEQFFVRRHNIDLEVVQSLIDFGINPSLPSLNLQIHTLLDRILVQAQIYGINGNFTMTLSQLIRYGAEIDSDSLEAGVGETGVNVLEVLAQNDVDIKNNGPKALCKAARLNNYQAISWLLEAGVDINSEVQTNRFGRLSIIMASNIPEYTEPASGPPGIYSASCEMNRFFIQHGARLKNRSQDTNSFDFLYHFLKFQEFRDNDELNKMKLFLSIGLTSNDLSDPTRCLLECCLVLYPDSNRYTKERLEIFELLVRYGAPTKSSQLLSSLVHYGGHHNLILKILETGMDINAFSKADHRFTRMEQTALQAAAERGDIEMASLLMSKGANINLPAVGFRGRTALQAACGWDPLTADEKARKMSLVQLLIESGADVNAPAADEQGQTALQAAAIHGDMEIAVLLLHHGANPNGGSGDGTALDGAAVMGRIDVVQLLLNIGALSRDRGQTGYDGAISNAEDLGHFAVADLIRQNVENDTMLFGGNPVLTF